MMNIIQTNHRPIAYEFVPLLLLLVLFCYCYLSCSAATVATTVAFYYCYFLLLSLLMFLATAVTRYFATTTLLADTNLSGVVESDIFSC